MLSRSALRLRACAIAAVVLVAVAAVSTDQNLPARYTALAVNLGDTPVRWKTKTVEIVVKRWSPEATRDRLLSILIDKGPEKLLDELRKSPRVGYIRTPDTIGYDLRFSQYVKGEDGGDRVMLATDRYISFWEQVNRPRTVDYPFTVIDLRFAPDGEGTGKMSLFAKIVADKKNNTVMIEDYGTQPVLLQGLRRETKAR